MVRVNAKPNNDRAALKEKLVEWYYSDEISDTAVAALAQEYDTDLRTI
jgi:hypothetical protein